MNSGSRSRGQELAHGLRHVARLAQHLAVVRLGCVEQQDGVTGRRGVEHDETVLPLRDRARERAEHRDLLGAGRAQILGEHGAPLLVQLFADRPHDLGAVGFRFPFGVDASHLQLRRRIVDEP